MKPFNVGGHSAYQDRVLNQLRKYYPDATNSLSSFTWNILEKFRIVTQPLDLNRGFLLICSVLLSLKSLLTHALLQT